MTFHGARRIFCVRLGKLRACAFPVGLVICLAALLAPQDGRAQQRDQAEKVALPRFYSLKSNPVNLRKGPGLQYPKTWVFRREGLPVEVLREHENWREVRDSDGALGWILRALVSQRRTALVTPWHLKQKPDAAAGPELTTLHSSARLRSSTVARLEPGTLVSLKTCDRTWCHVSIGRFRGYVEQKRLWGVYPQEIVR